MLSFAAQTSKEGQLAIFESATTLWWKPRMFGKIIIIAAVCISSVILFMVKIYQFNVF